VCEQVVCEQVVSGQVVCGQVVGGQAAGAGAGGGGGGIQNQKQEPHTKMWGKMCAMVQLHMCLVYSTHSHIPVWVIAHMKLSMAIVL